MNDWDNYLWNTYGNDYGYGDTYSEIVEEAINDTPTPKPLFDLFWGKRIGEAGVGVRVSYADSKDNHNSNADLSNLSGDVSSQQTVYFARQIGVLAGVGLSDIGPFQEMNLSLGYSFGMFEDSSISNSRQYPDQAKMDSWSIKDDGISALDVHMNLRHDLGENDQLKLYASGSVHSFGLKGYDNSIYDLTDTQVSADSRVGLKDKMTSGTIGLGLNHSVKSLNSVVSGGLKVTAARFSQEVSYLYDGQDIWQTLWTNGYTEWTRVTTHMTTLPAFVSVETGVLSWLTLRMGAQYDLFDQESLTYSNPYGSKTSVTHNNGGGINFSTGFGLRWKNWVLDGVLDTNDFENRIYNLQPGGGIHFNGTMVQLVKADLKYKF
jgi:hypothetical protein